ncbi:MAG TPA: hypothetical protein VMU84_00455, partial [Thermoanaerobaculia bacterium]|nr:hypothetical protein [Thermoanaerobaculia bacterium]
MHDLEGLQVAYLGTALAHYLDIRTGDIIDLPLDAPAPGGPLRFKRIPTRTAESDAEDRRLFAEVHAALVYAVDDATEFRRALSLDRMLEKKWFSFKN